MLEDMEHGESEILRHFWWECAAARGSGIGGQFGENSMCPII